MGCLPGLLADRFKRTTTVQMSATRTKSRKLDNQNEPMDVSLLSYFLPLWLHFTERKESTHFLKLY